MSQSALEVTEHDDQASPELGVPKSWSLLARFILYRLNAGRDVKIIIIARGSATGTGKTTLAVQICQFIHSLLQCTDCRYRNEYGDIVGGWFPRNCDQCPYCGGTEAVTNSDWDAQEAAHINIWDYMGYYSNDCVPGEALLLDEAELGAEKRRSMSESNVKFSQLWSALRFKNTVQVTTLPSMLQVDKRMEQLGDVLINVQRRGLARVHWLWLNDISERIQKPLVRNEFGHPEVIRFSSIDSDPAFRTVSEMKTQHFQAGGDGTDFYDEETVEKQIDAAEQQLRIDIAKDISDKTDLTQYDIAECIDRSQQWVSKAVNDQLTTQQ